MELGEKLLQARQEAGLSQRQLCGDVITRNMLSRIEHGAARPSMDTLRYLAGRLGKPVSYFLEEDAVLSPNQPLMEQVREAWAAGETEKARQLLQQYRFPDETFAWEHRYLSGAAVLAAARQALAEGKDRYARQLLEEADTSGFADQQRQRLLLLGRLPGADPVSLCSQLPSVDEDLLLRAEAALTRGEPHRAEQLLMAAEDRETPRWHLLLGRALLQLKEYGPAADSLQKAEQAYPGESLPLLEICFRELGDFRQAYTYACKQR